MIVHTGDGKGKTTAALGILLRAWGRGMKVVMLQFLKHRNARFGELRAAERMGVEVIPLGDGFTWTSRDPGKNQALARAGWERCRDRILAPEGAHDVIILDELTYPLIYGWLELDEVLETLRRRPPMRHVIITGRQAPQPLLDFADLVTEMRLVKHPYSEQGIRAQPGIEF
ncbi:cobinamide adenolsyltransferase [Limnochorda pilosa]|uniref:Cobinamide adenolsyltransferase n=1 Tax=Limnochorda pilosa TaxID=1555112 RepID=A0A0K2SQC1_LIMPI|nr:cobinamide adenolsyltransferase [Limnochorda pilosa]